MDLWRRNHYSPLGALAGENNVELNDIGNNNSEASLITNGVRPDVQDNDSPILRLGRPKVNESSTEQRLNTDWNPASLRTWVLCLWILFFALIIAALQIIFSISQNNIGISTTDEGKYYLWTYGPTGLFVVVTVLWRQVDYAVKSIQPWAELAKGPKPAKETLLLDYVTPFQLVAAYRALRNGHFAVFSGIIIYFMIKVITIVSTGIFSLVPVVEDGSPTPMSLNNTFYDEGGMYQSTAVDSRSTYTVYGHRVLNVSLPPGTTDMYAVQSFAPQGGNPNGSLSYTAIVDVFSAGLDCESGTLTYNTSFSLATGNTPVATFYNTTVQTSDCLIHGALLDAPDWYFTKSDKSPRLGFYGSIQNVTCLNLPLDDPTRQRYMIAVAYSEGFSQNNNTMLNSSNTVCNPRYELRKATVTLDVEGNVQKVNLTSSPPTQIPAISGLDVARGIIASMQESYALSSVSGSNSKFDVFVNLVSQDMSTDDPADLLDPAVLQTYSQRTYGRLAAQFANLYLMAPTSFHETISGSISVSRNRLLALETPIRWMQGISGGMLVFTIILLLYRPRDVVPRSVDSITAVAAILARSPDLENKLRDTGHLGLEELQKILSRYRYRTVVKVRDDFKIFSIQIIKMDNLEAETPEEMSVNSNTIKWTRPLVLHRVAILSTIAASIIAIISCEVLLSESIKNHGLANVSNDAVTRYSWLYVPVIVFVLLGTMFNIMDFQIEFSESYYALSRGFCEAPSSMLWYPLRHVSLHTSWNGLKYNRFALTASSISVILAPFLTIVVAGLFHTQVMQTSQPVTATALDFFNLSGLYGGDQPIGALVIEGNMSYPQWTYDELALPQLHFNLGLGEASTKGMISIDTPAVRAKVECTEFAQNRILNASITYDGYLSINISTPDGCGNSGYINKPDEYLQMDVPVPINSSGFFGSTLPTGFGVNCPTIAIFYGHVTSNQLDTLAVLSCTQSLERLDVNATFSLPDITISRDYPPQPYEGTARTFSTYYDAFPQLQVLNITGSNVSTTSKFDNVINAMIFGRDGVPASELLNVTTLANSFTHFYRQYMAQILNTKFRANFSSFPILNNTVSVANPLNGTYTYIYTDDSHQRLIQSPLSTHILTGVLLALLICASTIFLTVDMRRVLPKPIGSIAAVASLLAGSKIVNSDSGMVPQGAEWWSDEEWAQRGIWNGHMFRMGWWDDFGEPITSWNHKFEDPQTEIERNLFQESRAHFYRIDVKNNAVQ